jgi:UDP-4-amino-4,6-dideoxy-N-acetyl-beta-L-altrosamine N-acetyltransferase
MIRGEKIFLRPLKYEDWEKTITWRNNLEFSSLIMSHPFPVTEELEKEWIKSVLEDKNDSSVHFGICLLDSEELIGITKLFNLNWISRTCYFGIFLGSKENRGKKYGKEVTELIIKYAFNSLNLRKILLEVITNNQPAIKLYQKIGFVIEGKLKRQYYASNAYHDVLIMSLFQNNG